MHIYKAFSLVPRGCAGFTVRTNDKNWSHHSHVKKNNVLCCSWLVGGILWSEPLAHMKCHQHLERHSIYHCLSSASTSHRSHLANQGNAMAWEQPPPCTSPLFHPCCESQRWQSPRLGCLAAGQSSWFSRRAQHGWLTQWHPVGCCGLTSTGRKLGRMLLDHLVCTPSSCRYLGWEKSNVCLSLEHWLLPLGATAPCLWSWPLRPQLRIDKLMNLSLTEYKRCKSVCVRRCVERWVDERCWQMQQNSMKRH